MRDVLEIGSLQGLDGTSRLYRCDFAEHLMGVPERFYPERAPSLRAVISVARGFVFGSAGSVNLREALDWTDRFTVAAFRAPVGEVYMVSLAVLLDALLRVCTTRALRNLEAFGEKVPLTRLMIDKFLRVSPSPSVRANVLAWRQRHGVFYTEPLQALGDARYAADARGSLPLEGSLGHVAVATFFRESHLQCLDQAEEDIDYRRFLLGSDQVEDVFSARAEALERVRASDWTALSYYPEYGHILESKQFRYPV